MILPVDQKSFLICRIRE